MPLPRIRIDLPKKREERDEAIDPEEAARDGARLVGRRDREITFFHNFRLLPRISIIFPPAAVDPDEEIDIDILNDEALYQKMMRGEEGNDQPEEVEEEPPAKTKEVSKASRSLSIRAAIEKTLLESPEEGTDYPAMDVVEDEPPEPDADVPRPRFDEPEDPVKEEKVPAGERAIVPGTLVLIEGRKGEATRALAQNLCYGLLEGGLTVTYVTTSMAVHDFIMEMHLRHYSIARFLPDRQLLCIPVYPLLEGRGDKADLLGKLMSSPQLHKTDAIIVDTLTDFFDGEPSEMVTAQVVSFLQRFGDNGKIAAVVADGEHADISALGRASDVHLAVPPPGDKVVEVKAGTATWSGRAVLLFKIDPEGGFVSRPLHTVR
jgi:archaellum biogenesis ATPase FlaH